MKTREQKAQIIENLGKLLGECAGIAVTEYKGLKMKQLNELRDKIRPVGARFIVVKNTLARLAAKGTPYEELLAGLDGPNALVLLSGDASVTLKALFDFAKQNAAFRLNRGLIEGAIVDEAGLKAYSELPGKKEVQSMFVGVLAAPLAKMLGVLDAPARSLVGVIQAYEQKLGQDQAA